MPPKADGTSQAKSPVTVDNAGVRFSFAPADPAEETAQRAVMRAADHLLTRQRAEGYWKAISQSDVAYEAQDLFLRQFLGILDERVTAATGRWIRSQQREDGTWSLVHDGPGHLGTTVQAYVALRLTGDRPDAAHMRRSAAWIREQGGVAACELTAHIWLALLGWWRWDDLPEMPPEIIALPAWAPLNIYSFNSWIRLVLVPLTVISAHRPVRPAPFGIKELFSVGGPHHRAKAAPPLGTWEGVFQRLNRALCLYRKVGSGPVRRAAVNACVRWILERQEADGSWGGFSPMTAYMVLALHLHGYALDHPVLQAALDALENSACWPEDNVRMMETVQSPVWDTALSMTALADAGLPAGHSALLEAADWLLTRQTERPGDWAVRRPHLAPGGWSFEFCNETYPDNDDTSEVILALRRTAHHDRVRAAEAVRRAALWTCGMQSKDGGWGAFDADCTSTVVGRLPFFDIGDYCADPPTADVTAHVVEMMAALGRQDDPRTRRGVNWLLRHQEDNGAWFGRWGMNYIYGTGCAVPALVSAGVPLDTPAVRRAVTWLASVQNPDGGWGEDWRSYDDPAYIGRGPSTPSQTAWALLALLAAGERSGSVVRAGVNWLTEAQTEDGTWEEPQFTGTGVPGVQALNYGLYRHVFPLMALGRYVQRQNTGSVSSAPALM